MKRWRLRWANVLPGSHRGSRNRQWEAFGKVRRYYAVFVGISERGSPVWELNVWRGTAREVRGPLRSLAQCRATAQRIEMHSVREQQEEAKAAGRRFVHGAAMLLDGLPGRIAAVGVCPSCRGELALGVTLRGELGLHGGEPCAWFVAATLREVRRALEIA